VLQIRNPIISGRRRDPSGAAFQIEPIDIQGSGGHCP